LEYFSACVSFFAILLIVFKIDAKLKQKRHAAKKSRIILYFYSFPPFGFALCT